MSDRLSLRQELRQQLLECIFDTLRPIGLYSENARNYIELGDLAGLAYTVKCLVAHTRSIATTFNQLQASFTSEKESA